jgi:hypothetical protein
MTEPAETRPSRARPLGVVVIAIFLVLDAVLVVTERAFGWTFSSRAELVPDPEGWIAALITGLVILRIVAAVGLWLGWRRGWVLAFLLVGVSLVVDLMLYWNGQKIYHRMAIDVVLALYLNQGAVREYFEPGKKDQRRETAVAGSTPE